MADKNDSELGQWIKEHTPSPVTEWLKGHPNRFMSCFVGSYSGKVLLTLFEDDQRMTIRDIEGNTVEEAMANAMNALMVTEAPPPASSQSSKPPKSSA